MAMNIFDSMKGMTHYFIRPQDRFVLNSLEMVDCDEYLYRLLKNCGYERVVFFERAAGIRCFAYDEISNLSMTAINSFASVDMKDPKSVQDFLDRERDSSNPVPVQGKYRVKLGSVKASTFALEFEQHIAKALSAENIKTAIVMPLNIFKGLKKDGSNSVESELEEIAGIMNNLVGHNYRQENIIVFTMSNKEELLEVYNNRAIRNIHEDFPLLDNHQEFYQHLDEIFKKLDGRITLVDTIGIDEIANLLLRKKTLEPYWKNALAGIPYSKIYELAKLLREHVVGAKKHFKSIGEIKATYITTLNNYFTQKKDFVPELVKKSSELSGREVFPKNDRDAVCLDRVTHESTVFINTSLEADILAEMDEKLIGAEMQSAKDQLIATVNQFERKKKKYLQQLEEGKNPEAFYKNLCIFGPPGTGKTTIGKYMAKLMNAKGILSTDSFVFVEAASLKHEHIGRTGRNILDVAKKASGGVLLIDEFYTFDSEHSEGNGAKEAMDALISAINMYGDNTSFIIAGYEEKTKKVLAHNEGNNRRFSEKVGICEYSIETLIYIFDHLLLQQDVKQLEEGLRDKIKDVIEKEKVVNGEEFGNVGFVKNLLDKLDVAYHEGKREDHIYRKEDLLFAYKEEKEYYKVIEKEKENAEDVLRDFERFDETEVKDAKDQLLNNVYDIENAKMPFINMHFRGVSRGEKRELAELTGRLLYAKGILSSDKVLNWNSLPKINTEKDVDEIKKELADVGVLLLDEFRGEEEGFHEFILSLAKYYPRKKCIIVAEDWMSESLKESRESDCFPYEVDFPDYSTDALLDVLKSLIQEQGKTLDEQAAEALYKVMERDRRAMNPQAFNMDYLIGVILRKLRRVYTKIGRKDNRYTLEDVTAAFPEKKKVSSRAKKPKSKVFERLPLPEGWPEEPEESRIVESSEAAILYLETDVGEKGTGFLISKDGYALTCAHVIAGANKITAAMHIPNRLVSTDEEKDCEVVWTDTGLDIALLKLVGGGNYPYLPLSEENYAIGSCEKFVLRGYTFQGKDGGLHHFPGGIASDKPIKENTVKYYTIDGEATKGSSGSPLISLSNGKVIGILTGEKTSENTFKEGLNIMRPIKYFWECIVD